MAVATDGVHRWVLHPAHAFLVAAAVPLFVGALLTNIAYASSYQVQWSNFAAWMIMGGLILTGLALLWTLIDLLRTRRSGGRSLVYLVLLLAAWGLGLVNALVHAKDAWAIMPAGLVLSAIIAALVVVATWIGFSSLRAGGTR